eukprot:4480385-Pyramimonas_sp.AAC.1
MPTTTVVTATTGAESGLPRSRRRRCAATPDLRGLGRALGQRRPPRLPYPRMRAVWCWGETYDGGKMGTRDAGRPRKRK